MKINSLDNINFRASVAANKVQIMKKAGPKPNNYSDFPARLLEFNIEDTGDMQKLREFCKRPEFALYSYELPQDLERTDKNLYKKKHCFVLTDDREENPAKINIDNVLGMFTVYETNGDEPDVIKFFITNLQYRTKWECDEHKNEFMHIGNGMAEAAKEMFPQKSLYCYSEPWAVRFWEKNGFEQMAESEQHMILKR